MKNRIITFILLLISTYAFSQEPSWEWAKSNGGVDIENGNFITADSKGDVIVIGQFNSPSITFGNNTLVNSGFFDVYIVKYDSKGEVIWAKSFGGDGIDFPTVVCTNSTDNIIVTGYFNSPRIIIENDTLNNAGAMTNDVFLVNFDSDGNYLWAESIGGNNDDLGYGVTTDANNTIYIGGYYDTDTLYFGDDFLINNGGDDAFVCKFSSTGSKMWLKGYGGAGDDNVRGIDLDANGEIILIGEFDSPTISFGSTTLSNAGSFDLFMAKISPAGSVVWANKYGGNRDDKSISVSADELGNIFVTGFFLSDDLIFDTYTLSGGTPGNGEIWLTKFDLSGNVVWAVDNGGTLFDKGIGVVNDGRGGAFITGYFISESLTFGETTIFNSDNTTRDFYIAQYDAVGSPQWAYGAGGVNQDFGFSLCRFNSQIYVTGKFESANITIGSTTLRNASSSTTSDMFISKLVVPSVPVGILDNENQLQSVRVYPSPTNGLIKIDAEQLIKQVEIHSSTGELYHVSENTLIDINDLVLFLEKLVHF